MPAAVRRAAGRTRPPRSRKLVVMQKLQNRAPRRVGAANRSHFMRAINPVFVILVLLSGCGHFLEDNGVHLAFVLEDGAAKLRGSDASELVVRYETLDGGNDPYYIEITPSFTEGQAPNIRGSYLVVSGKSRGGTSSHNSAVFVPLRLYIQKSQGGVTEIVLQKHGDRVDVVCLR